MSAAELVGMSGSMPESVRSSDGAADDLIRQSCNGHKVEMVIRGEGVDLKPLARQALDVAAGDASEMRARPLPGWPDAGGE